MWNISLRASLGMTGIPRSTVPPRVTESLAQGKILRKSAVAGPCFLVHVCNQTWFSIEGWKTSSCPLCPKHKKRQHTKRNGMQAKKKRFRHLNHCSKLSRKVIVEVWWWLKVADGNKSPSPNIRWKGTGGTCRSFLIDIQGLWQAGSTLST